MYETLIYVGIAVVAILTIGLVITRLYIRSTKERTYVRTGFGGQKIIMNGGALVFPVLHETMPVNMNTMPIIVAKADNDSLRTKDKLRVNVQAEFYVRVRPDTEAIAAAAQTLGRKTLNPQELKTLIQGKLEDALRSVASGMNMEELNTNRTGFVGEVQKVAAHELGMNGLELESVSLTGLNQTQKDYFDPNNAFDAEGLSILTRQTQQRRREINDVERETEVLIAEKNRSTNLERLEIARQDREATLKQEQEIATVEATQAAEVARQRAEQDRQAQEAQIESERAVKVAGIERERDVQKATIAQEQAVETARIERERTVQAANIERDKTLQLAGQQRDIAVAQASRDQSKARAEAELARAEAEAASQQVTTVVATAEAERTKQIAVIAAEQQAEVAAKGVTVAADAAKVAAADQAEAARELARGRADAVIAEATGEAEAAKLRADAQERTYAVEAEGQQKLNHAANLLSGQVLENRLRMAGVEALPDIITASVRPLENIESIRIAEIGGLGGTSPFGEGGEKLVQSGNLAHDAVQAALRYRAQAPLVDDLMQSVFGPGVTLAGVATGRHTPTATATEK